jgi:hypothetical protein
MRAEHQVYCLTLPKLGLAHYSEEFLFLNELTRLFHRTVPSAHHDRASRKYVESTGRAVQVRFVPAGCLFIATGASPNTSELRDRLAVDDMGYRVMKTLTNAAISSTWVSSENCPPASAFLAI